VRIILFLSILVIAHNAVIAQAQVFEKDIISRPNRYEYGSAFSKDGDTCYFAVINNDRAERYFI
jgi:hypothetical protein